MLSRNLRSRSLVTGHSPQDFANGCAFGQLLHHHGMQPDFDKFVDTRHPDAMVNNFTRLQVWYALLIGSQFALLYSSSHHTQTTFLKLGVKFDTRTANSLMREEPGVAMRLLYSLKQNLGQVNKDVQVSMPHHSCRMDAVDTIGMSTIVCMGGLPIILLKPSSIYLCNHRMLLVPYGRPHVLHRSSKARGGLVKSLGHPFLSQGHFLRLSSTTPPRRKPSVMPKGVNHIPSGDFKTTCMHTGRKALELYLRLYFGPQVF